MRVIVYRHQPKIQRVLDRRANVVYIKQKETRSCTCDGVLSPVEGIMCCRSEDQRVVSFTQEGTI